MAVIDLWRRVTRGGVTEEMAPTEARYVVLTNSLIVLAGLVTLTYLPVSATNPHLPRHFTYTSPLLTLLFFSTLVLNRRGMHWLATTAFATLAILSQIYFALQFGAGAGNEFYFLPLMAAIFLIYPPGHERSALALTVVGFALFLGLVELLPRIEPLVYTDPARRRTYYVLAVMMTALLLVAVGYYSRRTTLAAEAALTERSAELADALAQIKDAQLQLVEAEKQATLGRVVAGIVHELNTPLGTLRSASDTISRSLQRCEALLADDRDARAEQRARAAITAGQQLCGVLAESSERISRTVDALKRFVSLDAAEQQQLDVREGLDTAVALLAEAHGERIAVTRDYGEVPGVRCFPAKLNQVFLSILQNAGQAIDGEGEIALRVARGDGDTVVVEIRDDGRGIDPGQLPGIFDVGFTRKGERVAMRLGLPMSKRHVEEIGGGIAIDSAPGRGTTVRLTLPVG